MPYFMNPFEYSFKGALVLADRQLSLNFSVGPNKNTSKLMIAFNQEPYNLTGNNNLTLNYSIDSGATWTALTVDVSTTAGNVAAAKAYEVASALNANVTFASLFTAYVNEGVSTGDVGTNWLFIKASKPRERWKMYISNSSAETILRFNKKAGLAQLPAYFARHTIANIGNYTDCVGMLIQLSNPLAGDDVNIVTNAGLSTTIQADWQLLAGRSGLFTFVKNTVDGSNRVTTRIEYPAGAVVGDFAKKTTYTYTGTNTAPDQSTEYPYVLTSGDLVTPT